MKTLILRAVVLSAALLAVPAMAQDVELNETALPESLASTVTDIFPQCWYCSNLDVHTFDVTWPEEGTIDQEQAAWAAIDYFGTQMYDTGSSISQAAFNSKLAGFNWEELPPEIRSSVAPGDTSWTASESSWWYMTAPDYCEYGYFYVLVFQDARKVVTVEVNKAHEC